MDAKLESKMKGVYVYELPIRIWHWVNSVAIVVLCVTGYFIGSPLPTVSGEASDNYLMGYIRFIHFTAAYIFVIGTLGRIYWAFAGNEHARQLILPPLFNKGWWKDFVHEARWYLFLEKEPKKHAGHNPVAQLAMFGMYFLVSIFMLLTGLALYSEGQGAGSWWDTVFGWVIPLFGQSQDVHTWHHLGMWFMIVFIITHIYAVMREDIMSRQTIISTMVSGWRFWKDDRD